MWLHCSCAPIIYGFAGCPKYRPRWPACRLEVVLTSVHVAVPPHQDLSPQRGYSTPSHRLANHHQCAISIPRRGCLATCGENNQSSANMRSSVEMLEQMQLAPSRWEGAIKLNSQNIHPGRRAGHLANLLLSTIAVSWRVRFPAYCCRLRIPLLVRYN